LNILTRLPFSSLFCAGSTFYSLPVQDGSNNLGSNVASGVYFYKLNAGDNYENMKKMVLLR
jgi:hypothetical protein